MEPLVAAVVEGFVLALLLLKLVWIAVSRNRRQLRRLAERYVRQRTCRARRPGEVADRRRMMRVGLVGCTTTGPSAQTPTGIGST